jgi:sugar lactone lactonase YvrE
MPIQPGLSRTAALLASFIAFAASALAVDTHVWQQDELNEFTRGTVKNLSIRSDGRLTLAPEFRQLADLATPYLWSVVEDSRGTLYCAGGAPTGATAKIFAVTAQGKSRTFAELSGLEIHALAIDREDRIYAATSPDSKIYRIGRDGKTELFFDTKAKYVWSMAFDRKGNLYAATGDQGVIYRVSPDGKGNEFFRTEEAHARSMVIDGNGNLIVGTEPGGYILRITPEGKSFVLYQTSKREVTALAEHDGTIYAAAAGGHPVQPTTLGLPSAAPGVSASETVTRVSAAQQQQQPQQPGAPPSLSTTLSFLAGGGSTAGGSDFYRVDQDGFAEKLWSSPSDVIYAIGFDRDGKPILGTGNRGIIYRVDSATMATQLINAPPTQVTGFLSGRNGTIYAVTGNVGQIYAVGPGYEKSGYLESEVLDVGSFAYWGKAHLTLDLHGGKAELNTRSGNVNRPQRNWSEWAQVDLAPVGGQVPSPPARFLQYRLTLEAANDGQSPAVNTIQIAYLPRNIAPIVKVIEVVDANYKASATPNFLEQHTTASGSPTSITLPALGASRKSAPSVASLESAAGLTLQYAKGYITARWSAADENGDSLFYRVEIRGKDEKVWRLVKDKLEDTHFSFDGSTFADGEYVLRVIASDAPSNTPAEALTGSLVSESFTIDNTPPRITPEGQSEEQGQTVVRFSAKDALSWLDKAEYSVNGGDWTLLNPVNRVSDSQQLHYELRLPRSNNSAEEIVAVRVFDDNDNEAVARFVVTGH